MRFIKKAGFWSAFFISLLVLIFPGLSLLSLWLTGEFTIKAIAW